MTISDTSTIIGNGFRNAELRDLDAASLALAVEQTTGVDQKLHDALSLAALAHRHQTRPGRNGTLDPYITHPLRNTLRLVGFGCSDTTVLAATALHDTVEDQPEQLVALLGGDTSAPVRDEALRQFASHFGGAVA
ncbi:bifunctional (p)ppGpp synthetase/guanosine-3',5'-bis(diphosphate) 3'-pyrophosphohydrolase [Rhodococcoides yunnanense]|uniref:bifunctional (p)ppGpp synthetase/guanosine-3',5'-bis(diphosphate) 3'-pyrophosphohydrolase n=1 Tax=Rhodococcoides yunnanense TaxID=278209 RepID=UPI00093244E8|nr:bifunctional (p)ppGpp synthetase/guanosine-3',5'-bis(diphosphate) 3'-pyrophosphohydrolase [Rhodococcus yunnanensis]